MQNLNTYLKLCYDFSDRVPYRSLNAEIFFNNMKLWLAKGDYAFFGGAREHISGISWLEVGISPDRTFRFNREVPEEFGFIIVNGEIGITPNKTKASLHLKYL